MRRIFLLLVTGLLLTGCLTVEKSVRYTRPAEISVDKRIKTIAVLSSGRSREIIYEMLFSALGKAEARKRFDLIDRENLDAILREQKLYNSDDFDDSTAVSLGQLSGAQAVILGSFKSVTEKFDASTMELNRRFITGYQTLSDGTKIPQYRYAKETVPSTVATYLFNIDIRMLNIEKGTLIHNERKSYKFVYETYTDNQPDNFVSVARSTGTVVKVFPAIDELMNNAGKDFSEYFAKKIAPYSVTEDMSFEIISGDKVNERFIRFIKSDLYEEALELMLDSLSTVKNIEDLKKRSKHYYNIACIYEIKSDFEKSQDYYSKAVKDDPSELHLDALKAIKDRIKLKQKLDRQLSNE